jgi:hypothetical protein
MEVPAHSLCWQVLEKFVRQLLWEEMTDSAPSGLLAPVI